MLHRVHTTQVNSDHPAYERIGNDLIPVILIDDESGSFYSADKVCNTSAANVQGSGSRGFSFQQNQSLAAWVINHNMNCHPLAIVIDSSGHQVFGDIHYNSPNQLSIFFSSPFGGWAYLSGYTWV